MKRSSLNFSWCLHCLCNWFLAFGSFPGVSPEEVSSEYSDEVCMLQAPAAHGDLHPERAQVLSAAMQLNDSMVSAVTSRQSQQLLHSYHSQHSNAPGVMMVCSLVSILACIAVPLVRLCFTMIRFMASDARSTEANATEVMVLMERGDPLGQSVAWFFGGACNAIAYSAVIPGSYDTSRLLGADAAFSGLVISMTPFVSLLGYFLIRVWISHRVVVYHRCWIASTLCIGGSAGIYWISGLFENRPQLSLCLLLASRAVLGVASGVSGFLRDDVKMRVLLPERMPNACLLDSMGTVLGLGGGPMLSNLVERMLGPWQLGKLLLLTTSGSFITVLATVPLCQVIHYSIPPDLSTAAPTLGGFMSPDVSVGGKPGLASTLLKDIRLRATASAVILLFLGQMLSQSVEIGSALMLEVRFQWQEKSLGIAVGVSILAGLPLAGIVGMLVNSPPETSIKLQRGQLCYCLLLLTSLLFLPINSAAFPGWLPILIADMLCFALLAALYGHVLSILYGLADRDGDGAWSTGNLVVLQQIGFVGRGIAGPVSRFLLGQSGRFDNHQTVYAIILASMSCSSLAVMRLFLQPGLIEAKQI